MLAGRRSLTSLVGKRKRTLSSSVLDKVFVQDVATPPPPSTQPLPRQGVADGGVPGSSLVSETISAASDRGAEIASFKRGEDDDRQTSSSDRVDCSVRGCTIHDADCTAVNCHLDSCLSWRTKRRLTQKTLLQLNFFTKSAIELDFNGLCNVKKHPMERETNTKGEGDKDSVDFELDSKQTCQDVYLSTSLPYARGRQENCNDVLVDNMTAIDAANVKAGSVESILSYAYPNLNLNKVVTFASELTGRIKMLETCIVGHRFHDNLEIRPGSGIFIMREPGNANDHHAIKVLSNASGCETVLGYIPRELSRYLSPLIDNYGLKIEGIVVSLPMHPSNAIPVNLFCEKMLPDAQESPCNMQEFESLWQSAVKVVELSQNFHLNKMRHQKNFCLMIQEVLSHHGHLLTYEEKLFLGSFFSLSDDSQRIFIRLYTRKGPWFCMSDVHYPEVLDREKAIKELQLAGYLCFFHTISDPCKDDVRRICKTLTVKKLQEIANLLLLQKIPKSTRKEDIIEALCATYEDGTCPFVSTLSDKAGVCLKVSPFAELLLWRLQRLFFLNGEQDLSAFVLVDLGLVKYPSYVCNVSKPIFSCRNGFLAYEEAIEVAQIMDQSLDEGNDRIINRCINISNNSLSASKGIPHASFSECQADFLSCFSVSWVYSRVVSLGVSFLEREHRYEESIELLKGLLKRFLSDGRRGHWTLRLSVDLEHIGFITESLRVAEEGISDPRVRSGFKIALQRRILRLGKPPRRWKVPKFATSVKRKLKEVHVPGRPLNCETGKKNRYYGYTGEQCGVEQLALQYYSGEGGGWRGAHTQNGIWLTIFGLLMWDVIFADVPNVFHTKFQTAPLDLGSVSFYESRKDLIESQLQRLERGMAEEMLIISWESHVGTACRGVNWQNYDLSDLRAIVACVGGGCLASICRLLAQNYRSWSSGMPDLLLWRFHGDGYNGEAKLVEVKGPKDRISEQQRAWILFFMDLGFDIEVCRVGPMP